MVGFQEHYLRQGQPTYPNTMIAYPFPGESPLASFPTTLEPINVSYDYCSSRCRGGKYAISVDCEPDNPSFEFIDPPVSTSFRTPVSLSLQHCQTVLHFKNFDKSGIHDVILANQNDPCLWKSLITMDRFEF